MIISDDIAWNIITGDWNYSIYYTTYFRFKFLDKFELYLEI